MRAAVLAVGSELLGSDRVDSNSLRLTAVLARYGVKVATKAVVGDDHELIARTATSLMDRYELLLVTGGLGPTQDDLTRESIAAAVDRRLVRDDEVLADMRRKFARFGIEMAAVNEKQADVIEGSVVLENRRGTAPGLRLDHGGCTLFLFPGVPTEVDGLIETSLLPWLAETTSGSGLETRCFKVACVPESTLEQWLEPFYAQWGTRDVSLLPSAGEVTIRLSASGEAAVRQAWLEPRSDALRGLLGERVFTEDLDGSLEEACGLAVAAARWTVATAESCTGGLIAERLTRVAGSSGYFLGSVVSYANDVKTAVLGVPAATLERDGAVSRSVAAAMATGARRAIGSDVALAVTGIAGPGGGTQDKPVGTVHVALAGPDGEDVVHRELHLPGDRSRIRLVTSQWALEMLRRLALEAGGPARETG